MPRNAPIGLSLAFLPFLLALGPTDAAAAEVSFVKDVQPFLNKYCVECHQRDKAQGGVVLDSYKALIQGNDPVVRPRQPNRSDLVKVLDSSSRKPMPPRKSTVRPTPDEIAMIRAWVQAGAVDDTDAGKEEARGSGEIRPGARTFPSNGGSIILKREQ